MSGPKAHEGGVRAVDRAPRVSFQGEFGSFSEEAVRGHFDDRVHPVPCRDFARLVQAVEEGSCEFGMIPVENSLAGSVVPAWDALADADVTVVSEVIRPIRHHLLGIPGSRVPGLSRVLSHPVALAQCRRFLAGLTGAQVLAVYDTAGAALQVAREGDPGVAAIAPRGAAERYGLEILASGIQDRPDNQTRFYLIRARTKEARVTAAPRAPGIRQKHRTVMVVELADAPGSLFRALECFARADLNLSRLESRPGTRPWTYRFILEVQAPDDAPAMAAALERISDQASALRVLGSFPVWTEEGEGCSRPDAPATVSDPSESPVPERTPPNP